jgi:uncharacterized protein
MWLKRKALSSRLEKNKEPLIAENRKRRMKMLSDLTGIIDLHKIDILIEDLEKDKLYLPSLLKEHKDALKAEEKVLADFKADREEREKARRGKERDLATLEEQIGKFKQQQMAVKTNEEYTAINKEIEHCNKKIDGIETDILQMIERIDIDEDKINRLEANAKQAKENLADEEKETNAKLEEIKNKLEGFNQERKGFVANISRPVLSRYERLFEKYGSSAVVTLKGSSCGGCNMKLIPQLINEVAASDRMVACNNCSRILVNGKAEAVKPGV